MKQKLLYIIMCLTAEMWCGGLWGQTTSYVLEESGGEELSNSQNGKILTMSGPGAKISFEAAKNMGTAIGSLFVEKSTDGSNWSTLQEIGVGSLEGSWGNFSFKSFEYSVGDNNVRYIRFRSTGSYKKKYRNVKVTRATTLSLAPGVSSTLDMGSIRIGKSVSNTIRVAYNNTTYNQNLTGTCTNTFFTVTSKSLGETGEADITINYNPTSAGTHTGTVKLSMAGATVSFTVTGTAAEKGTPAFTWNVSTAYKNHSYSDFFTSTNTDTNYTITSSNPSLGNVVGGKLVFYDGEGTIVFTVSQDGNEDWNAHSESFTVNVIEAQNHLPLTITSDNFGTLVRGISGSCAWNSGGIRLGDGLGGFDWDDKLAEINFEGIPDRITFDYEPTAETLGQVTQRDWNVRVSSDGNNWETIWSSEERSGSADITITDATVRYVRLCWSGNYGGLFSNVTITERRYLTADKANIEFGADNIKGNSVAQTFTLSHCNAGYGVTITSSDRNFIATPNPVTTTGGDIMGTETITVQYLNNALGAHSGTITISDPNGSNEDVTITVSGTTKTYYYAHAEAESTEGGSATVSFESSDAATTSSTDKRWGPTTSSAPKTNIYFKAVASNEDFDFVGWKLQLSDAEYVSRNAVYTIENFACTSEDQNAPSAKKLIAVFRKVALVLEPENPDYLPESYRSVTLHRTFLQGYNTIALPFDTNVQALTGRNNENDWVAQLSSVTYNQHDGYTLFFQKVSTGFIQAFRPYILYLGEQVVDPSWTNIDLPAASPATITPSKGYPDTVSPDGSSYTDWKMTSNFTAGFNMNGKYGIVNAGLKLGGAGSTLNAFTAYITPPANGGNVKVRTSFLDFGDEGTALENVRLVDEDEVEGYYATDGRRLAGPQKGIVVVKYRDGRRMKVKF